MNLVLKNIFRRIIPKTFRLFIWSVIPKFSRVVTLYYNSLREINNLISIPDNYKFKEISGEDISELKRFYNHIDSKSFQRNVPKRLNSLNCKGFAFIESKTGEIVYLNWIHKNNKNYLSEFNFPIKSPFIFWDSAYCLPEHRHRGLHERMEQELHNYTITNDLKNFYMQIHTSNRKGVNYAYSKGYIFVKESLVISWPVFLIYRNFWAFCKNPFRKVYS